MRVVNADVKVVSGRPRDDDVSARILSAARAELSGAGLDRFSLRSVARRAGVSRDAVALRWADADLLIAEAIDTTSGLPPPTDTGSLRGDLIAVTKDLERSMRPESLRLQMRVAADAALHPTLYRRFLRTQLLPGRARVVIVFERARDRGELVANADPGWLADGVIGAMLLRTMSSAAQRPPTLSQRAALTATFHALATGRAPG